MDLARPTLSELKQALVELERGELGAAPTTAPAAPPLATGWPALDTLLGGGVARGRVTEVVGARSSGKTTLALAAAARVGGASSGSSLVAWIDATRELYPPAAAALGVDLARLLVVRPPPTALAVARAAEILARSRAFALIVLDMPASQRLPDQAVSRLRTAAHDTGVALLALSTTPALPHAATRLDVTARWPRPVVVLQRGGAAPPGTRVEVALGAPSVIGGRAEFRAPERQAALAAAAPADLGGLVLRTGRKQSREGAKQP